MSETFIKPSPRIEVIDAVRGFAVAAILLIHCSNQFLYAATMQWAQPEWLVSLNESSKFILYYCFENKAYAIFALLFGFTYALQWEKRAARGEDFRLRMAWRMVLLLGFGFLNAAFFMGGDPLVFYALVMLLVIPLIKLGNKLLLVLALLAFAQIPDLIHGFYPFYPGLTDIYYTELIAGAKEENFFIAAYANATVGVKAALAWAIETGRISQTFGLFLLGIVLYRTRFVEKSYRYLLSVGGILWLAFLALKLSLVMGWLGDLAVWTVYLNLLASLVTMMALVLLFRVFPKAYLTRKLSIYGRMSLTNFVGASVICAVLFYAWGFHLATYLGTFLSVMLGLLVLVFQIALSGHYLRRFKQGPLEKLWHRLTWLR